MAQVTGFTFVVSNVRNDGKPSKQPMLRLQFERGDVTDDIHVLNIRGESDLEFMRALHGALTDGSLAESLARIGRETAAAGRTVAQAPVQEPAQAPASEDRLARLERLVESLVSAQALATPAKPATNGAVEPAAQAPAKPATDFPF